MGAAQQIREAVLGWEGVTSHPHRFGGEEFRLGRRELGHLHGDRLADLPFPRRVATELIADGRAQEHHWVRDSGWVSRPIRTQADVEDVVALFRLAYERAEAAVARRAGATA